MENKTEVIEYSPEEADSSAFMVIWQNIDGTMEIAYLDFYSEAKSLCKQLKVAGRNPKMWRSIKW